MSATKLTRHDTYPLADEYRWASINERRLPVGVKAMWNGEKRPPRKGEWYLSGCPIDAYLAANDLDQPFHIAKLVRTKTVTRYVVLGDL